MIVSYVKWHYADNLGVNWLKTQLLALSKRSEPGLIGLKDFQDLGCKRGKTAFLHPKSCKSQNPGQSWFRQKATMLEWEMMWAQAIRPYGGCYFCDGVKDQKVENFLIYSYGTL
jgi:hypothetical protein